MTEKILAQQSVWKRIVEGARQVVQKSGSSDGLAEDRITALERSILNGNLKLREERTKRERSGTAEFIRQEDGAIVERKASPRPAAYYRRG